ncbi:MAG TPA: gliding motility-associated ABC transporter substrate-binding protein GldG [Bacteroidales bacterium]|jgi:gliding-associated putative ABC transporter substrate-binding component GldG|nr:gliding motility-associated ABC transporter substrate-binding protein GldG [Bacteroidales bacterium]HQH24535.1 gliding motility-associated ABC transporter substrate-binding protein GldG [Bacteroidales bacterium]HQJ83419.1 gliding motility-associated ABC transporter substrate-binding protein GldG [Bacteroidales bacterium]
MQKAGQNENIRIKEWLQFLIRIAAVIVIALLLSLLRIRIDLTEDRRYTLSEPTRRILAGTKNDIFIQVYLDGDMPVPLKRLRRSVKEMLEEFRVASKRKIDYEFINPADARDPRQREAQYASLYNKGLNPVNIQASDSEGGKTQKMIFPGMLINYNEIEVPVNFLKNNPSVPYEQNILHSIEGLEYEMIQTIATVSSDTVYKVAFLEGHNELAEIDVADITIHLAKFFTIDRGAINGRHGILDNYAAVVIAGPAKEFSESDKLVLDQYIMNGGKVLWLAEQVEVNADSLATGGTIGLYRPLNIEDQLFRYGVRINPEVIQDLDCMVIRVAVSAGEQQQMVPAPWVYYPRLYPSQDHPITKNLNRIKGMFVNTIDTVGLDPAIRKTVLLTSSAQSRTITPPVIIRLKEAEQLPDEQQYSKSHLSAAVLLEGVFPSAFRNRMISGLADGKDFAFRDSSEETRMIVVADGDIIRNEVRRMGNQGTPYPLGQDRLTGEMMGNRDFIINCLNYLVDDHGLMELRSREMKLRLLDRTRIREEKLFWQMVNLVVPVLLVIMSGLAYSYFRKRIYTRQG